MDVLGGIAYPGDSDFFNMTRLSHGSETLKWGILGAAVIVVEIWVCLAVKKRQ